MWNNETRDAQVKEKHPEYYIMGVFDPNIIVNWVEVNKFCKIEIFVFERKKKYVMNNEYH